MPTLITDSELSAWVMSKYIHNLPHWGFDLLGLAANGATTDYFHEVLGPDTMPDQVVEGTLMDQTNERAVNKVEALVMVLHRNAGNQPLTDIDKKFFTRFLVCSAYYGATPRAMYLRVGNTLALIKSKDLL